MYITDSSIIDQGVCGWDTAQFFILSDNVFGNFIYYSHLFPVVAILVLAIFVLSQDYRKPTHLTLFFLALTFSIWSIFDLILWATEKPEYTMFFWSILIYFDLLIYVGALYFVYTFINNKYPHWKYEVLIAALFLPLFLFAHTSLNLIGYDYTNCYREAWEGPLWFYTYAVELGIAIWIVIYGIRTWFRAAAKRSQIALVTIGMSLFLISFSLGNITGSIEIDWELGQYGLFGMPIFLAFLTYLIVRYQSLNIKVIGAEALVVGIGILITSLLFLRTPENIRIVSIITLAVTTIMGVFLVKSVRREVDQREEIERLAKDLARANTRLRKLDQAKSEFVSIASHQLRSPLTSIRGYASMLLEGSYGKLTKRATTAISRIHESSRYMALTVEDFLNVSRIEAGTMKYELSDFDICTLVQSVYEDMKPTIAEKNLAFDFTSHIDDPCLVRGDFGKVRQIVQNIIDNAVKYTPSGTITITLAVTADERYVEVRIADTGIGMSRATIDTLFQKFTRAHNANSVNVIGSGLGLYVAEQMAKQMKSSITADSEGEGKGSTFTLRLPRTISDEN